MQFGSFLSNCLSIDDYSGRLPSPAQLLVEYNLNPDVAFFLLRPMISHKIAVSLLSPDYSCRLDSYAFRLFSGQV